jgi:uncharacterized protein (TIGR03000 family)
MRTVFWTTVLILGVPGFVAAASPAPAQGSRPATVDVYLPADAQLTVNGKPTKATSASRAFITAPLESGRDYPYTFRATLARGDRTFTVEQRVTLRPGHNKVLSLFFPGAEEQSYATSTTDGFARPYRPSNRVYRNYPATRVYYYYPSRGVYPPAYGTWAQPEDSVLD